MNKTKIEWCDMTLNPVVGCTFGCSYCYAKKMNDRFGWIKEFSKPQVFINRLDQLAKLKKPQNIFMNSVSDIADWKNEWINEVISYMKANPRMNYLFLTKRPQKSIISGMTSNLWLGTSITKKSECINLSYLIRRNTVSNYYVSIEPIMESLDFFQSIEDKNIGLTGNFKKLKWIIIGAETGNRKNKVIPHKKWIDDIVYGAKKRNIPVFMKESLVKIVGEENMLREFPKGLMK